MNVDDNIYLYLRRKMETKEKFYKKTWFAIVMTIFIYPLGMYLVWTSKKLGKPQKIIATVIGGLFFLIVLVSDTSAPEIELNGDSTLVLAKDEVITEDQLLESAIANISDNKTEMAISDIEIEGFSDVDFSTEGKYKLNFKASDEAENEAVVPYTISIELSAEQQAEQAEAEEAAAAEQAEAENANRENEKALKSAESYVKIMAFSEQGLRGQLEFEGFTSDQIDYAIDNVEVDWNEEAVQSATSYSNTLSMSSSAIYDQLIFEGFTPEQAQYGIDHY